MFTECQAVMSRCLPAVPCFDIAGASLRDHRSHPALRSPGKHGDKTCDSNGDPCINLTFAMAPAVAISPGAARMAGSRVLLSRLPNPVRSVAVAARHAARRPLHVCAAKIAVIGGSGGTGSECIYQALEAGDEVVTLVRTPSKVTPAMPFMRRSLGGGSS